jgi:AcrR family transcriptional regulator
MNTQITSAEEILKAAQKILLEHGASALNMRAVAAACGVSVGSIYNYFPSKSALIGATIESVWTEIFRPFTSRCYTSFNDAASALLAALTDGEGRYPGFFSLHALSFASGDKAEGRARMAQHFSALHGKLVEALENDTRIRTGVFDGDLSRGSFARYVMSLAISQQIHPGGSSAALLAMIRNCIY